ncbi:acyl-CoA reductase-like NAD-dependent aldehyde dehydrogenase [Kibdelosporangium banguiense]|uniref:Acyl-CoA reductase-like NAD-dependent aldehyde dehydrogenase n=1 Tax=Kibdelosporangium banguiense TaxID=1365924 RepID=A0ABS4T9I4_9PSEU|nr:aldehyde dehydrogenase family protein [Kibdelosporangium banguiense]MBP2321067.1 acyl-CoA reductase-like NAD-dependent aldehyde dehydrogenase [Kibdelosporangium banguiense]
MFQPPYPAGLPIGSEWVTVPSTVPVTFPYDGTVVADAPLGSEQLAHKALDEAVAIKAEVAKLSSRARRQILDSAAGAIIANRAEFEHLLVLETGKPLVDCRTEVARTIVTLQASAEEVARVHGETVPLDLLPSGDGLVGYWTRRPIGVVVGIAGFNYPLLLAAHKIAPSVAAGCPVICKPAPATPLATLWLVDLMRTAAVEAGAPAGIVQLVTGDAEVGVALVTDRRIGAVSFTGSSTVGHQIARDAAPVKTLLELGSNAAMVVAADADLDAAVNAVLRGGFYASGQACISVQRLIVLDAVAEEFTAKLLARLGEVVTGDPREEETRVSALIDERSTKRVLQWVEVAVSAGARILGGGGLDGGVIRPTVLTNVPAGSACWDEEIFGPVVCLRTVSTVDEAFAMVNDSRYGLNASVFTSSLATAHQAIDTLEVGAVVVNDVPGFRADTMPYGGVKDSGIGREGPRFAIEELTVTRMAVIRPA